MNSILRETTNGNSRNTCVICLSSVEQGDPILAHTAGRTEHVFHPACFTPWAEKYGFINIPCPYHCLSPLNYCWEKRSIHLLQNLGKAALIGSATALILNQTGPLSSLETASVIQTLVTTITIHGPTLSSFLNSTYRMGQAYSCRLLVEIPLDALHQLLPSPLYRYLEKAPISCEVGLLTLQNILRMSQVRMRHFGSGLMSLYAYLTFGHPHPLEQLTPLTEGAVLCFAIQTLFDLGRTFFPKINTFY